ncbi:MAG: hypothetical protein ACI84K_000802 [Pseudohongiellaceae bacterium]|jgi:hypothetical protein
MTKSTHLLLTLLLASCASFNKTDIPPGQPVIGLGFSFTVPTQKSWFAVEYGTSHRIKLSQLNHKDSYSILVSITRGPYQGMYQNAEAHLQSIQYHQQKKRKKPGFVEYMHQEWIDSKYGDLCIRYTFSGENWKGRNSDGPAIVDEIGLSCPHPYLHNALIRIELLRRSETDADKVDLAAYAETLFSSFEYYSLD